MRETITCQSCGTILGVPKAGIPGEGFDCHWCGKTVKIGNQPPPASVPIPEVPKSDTSAKPPNTRKWADDEDDDGLPYSVPANEIKSKPCVSCGFEIGLQDVICVHCGHDSRTKEKTQRTFSPIDRTWEQGWHFSRRMLMFLLFQILNSFTMFVGIAYSEHRNIAIGGTFTYIFLQAFILGTYPSIRVRRNKKGQVEITQTWRFCFVPLPTKKLDWRKLEGVIVGAYDGSGFADWIIFFSLLSFMVIPAILWWWFAIKSDRFFTALTRQHGAPDTYVYRGLNETQSKEIAQTISDVTGLTLHTPL